MSTECTSTIKQPHARIFSFTTPGTISSSPPSNHHEDSQHLAPPGFPCSRGAIIIRHTHDACCRRWRGGGASGQLLGDGDRAGQEVRAPEVRDGVPETSRWDGRVRSHGVQLHCLHQVSSLLLRRKGKLILKSDD